MIPKTTSPFEFRHLTESSDVRMKMSKTTNNARRKLGELLGGR